MRIQAYTIYEWTSKFILIKGKYILIFQHEPVSTGVPTDESVNPYYDAYNGKRNFYSGPLVFSKAREMKEEDKLMYEVLKESTDVIKGIFCGHFHSLFYQQLESSGQ